MFSAKRDRPSARALLALGLGLAGAAAVAEPFDDLAKRGQEAMNAGRYEDAIKAYEQITTKGQTYVHIMEVKFDLAWAYYAVGEFAKAVPIFQDLSGVRAPSEDVKQQSLFLMADCEARWAGTMPTNAPERKKHLDKSIELHRKFQADYPKNPNIPESLYGLGYALFLYEKYDEAATELLKILNNYKTASCLRDAQYLLATVYARQARDRFLAKKEAEAKPFLEKARAIYAEISQSDANLGLANDGAFAMAETWYEAGQFREAIRYYMNVRAKREVQRDLQRRMDALRSQLSKDLAAHADTSGTRRQMAKITDQIERVKKAPDMMISAFFRAADCYYKLGRFDESRIILQHLTPFADGEQKINAAYMVTANLVEQGKADEALKAYNDFIAQFGANQPVAEMADVAIAQLFLDEDRIAEALPLLERSLDAFPAGQGVEDAAYMKLSAEYMSGQYDKCKATCDFYLEKFPKGTYAANAIYLKAMACAQQKQWEPALAAMDKLAAEFPKGSETFKNMDEAAYHRGWILTEAKKFEDAVKHYGDFLAQFKDSKYAPNAMYQQAIALGELGRDEEARATLRNLAAKYPDHEVGPAALYQIAIMYYKKEDFSKMFDALADVVHAFPRKPIAAESYYWMGWIVQGKDGMTDEAGAYYDKSLECDESSQWAPDCALQMAVCAKGYAESMGLPTVLPPDRRALYNQTMRMAASLYEDLMVNYPATSQALEAVPGIADVVATLVRMRQMTEEQAADFYAKLRARRQADPERAALVDFSYGSCLMKMDLKEKALAQFKKALQTAPDALVSPTVLSDYAKALMEANALDEAAKVFEKIIADYPEDKRVIAPAEFELANVHFLKNEFDQAKELYNKVLTDYPWYQEGRKGKNNLAMIEEKQGNFEVAEKLFTEVWKQEQPGEARLGAILGVARCQIEQAAKSGASSAAAKENLGVAFTNLHKLTVMYPTFTAYASEGYWLKARIYQMNNQKQEEANTCDILNREYGKTKYGKMANERLQELLKQGIVPTSKPEAAPAAAPAPTAAPTPAKPAPSPAPAAAAPGPAKPAPPAAPK